MLYKLSAKFFRSQFERTMLTAYKYACVAEDPKNPIQEDDPHYVMSINQFLVRLKDEGLPQDVIDRCHALLIENDEVAVLTNDHFFEWFKRI